MEEKKSGKFWIILVIVVILIIFATPALNSYLHSRGVNLDLNLNFGDFGFTKTVSNIFSNIGNSFKGWGR